MTTIIVLCMLISICIAGYKLKQSFSSIKNVLKDFKPIFGHDRKSPRSYEDDEDHPIHYLNKFYLVDPPSYWGYSAVIQVTDYKLKLSNTGEHSRYRFSKIISTLLHLEIKDNQDNEDTERINYRLKSMCYSYIDHFIDDIYEGLLTEITEDEYLLLKIF